MTLVVIKYFTLVSKSVCVMKIKFTLFLYYDVCTWLLIHIVLKLRCGTDCFAHKLSTDCASIL